MQINKISGINLACINYQNNINASKPISFGDLDYSPDGYIYGIKSKSDIINDIMEEKTQFAADVRKDAKKTFKQIKKYYKQGKKESFKTEIEGSIPNTYVRFNKPASYMSPYSATLYEKNPNSLKDTACEEYYFNHDEDKPLSSYLTVKKDDVDTIKEYEFYNGNLISYEETKKDGSSKIQLGSVGGKSFIYKEKSKEGENFVNKITLKVTGQRHNEGSRITLNESGDNNKYIYDPKTEKWTLVKMQNLN